MSADAVISRADTGTSGGRAARHGVRAPAAHPACCCEAARDHPADLAEAIPAHATAVAHHLRHLESTPADPAARRRASGVLHPARRATGRLIARCCATSASRLTVRVPGARLPIPGAYRIREVGLSSRSAPRRAATVDKISAERGRRRGGQRRAAAGPARSRAVLCCTGASGVRVATRAARGAFPPSCPTAPPTPRPGFSMPARRSAPRRAATATGCG